MISIKIPAGEYYNPKTNEFVKYKEHTLRLEHSLRSMAKWESKWHKPFLSKDNKTNEEIIDYLRCMTLNTADVDDCVYYCIPGSEMEKLTQYMEDPMTATTITRIGNQPKSRAIVTAEILYYDMIALNIPFECEKWHINRLLMLIEVCNEKNKPSKKIPRNELISRNKLLNAARRKRLGTKG